MRDYFCVYRPTLALTLRDHIAGAIDSKAVEKVGQTRSEIGDPKSIELGVRARVMFSVVISTVRVGVRSYDF